MDNTVVVDCGSSTLKAGLAASFPNDQEPSVITPSAVLDGDKRERRAVVRGQVEDWEALESLLHYVLYDRLRWISGAEGQLLFCEPLFTSRADRELLTQLLFENFHVSGAFLQDTAALSLYAVGKLTGCVVDMGHGKIDVVPVSEGQVQTHGMQRLPLAGEDMTKHIKQLIREKHNAVLSDEEATLIKERCAYAAASHSDFLQLQNSSDASSTPLSSKDAAKLLKQPSSAAIASTPGMLPQLCSPPEMTQHTLPDGNQISIGPAMGAILGESLFNPQMIDSEGPGLADVCCECTVGQNDPSLRKQLAENLMVCGGASSIVNLQHRLFQELHVRLPPSVQVGLCTSPEYMPEKTLEFAQWMGGAILSKVAAQHGHFVSKGEYDEIGPGAVHKKC